MKLTGVKKYRTTSFHLQSNGLVERFHRQLKSSLKCHESTWTEALPFVPLGTRNTIKCELEVTSSELVYGATLRLPGDMVLSSEKPNNFQFPDHENVKTLRNVMQRLRYQQYPAHNTHQTYVPKELKDSSHVLLRVDHVKKPLDSLYEGPYRVLE